MTDQPETGAASVRPGLPGHPGHRRDLAGIQYLRGIAALLVVIYHLSYQVAAWVPGYVRPVTTEAGVDIFFVISGFVMVYSTGAGARLSAGLFLRRRLARIVPLYWLATAATVAILLIAPQFVKTSRLEPAHAAASFLFLAWPNPAGGDTIPLVTPGWTLNLEMLFYAAFALAILIGRRDPARVPLLAAAPMIVLSASGLIVLAAGERLPGAAGFYTQAILLEFVFGMGLALAMMRWPGFESRWVALLLVAGFAILLLPDEGDVRLRCLRYGLPALAIVAAAVFTPLPRSRALHRLGDISYSLYLSHFFVVSFVAQVWRRLGLGTGAGMLAAFYVAGVVAAVVVAGLCWRFAERPLTAWAKRALRTESERPA